MPRMEVVIGISAQDVQISGAMTGSLVCATFKNHEAVREAEGHDIGAPSFLVTSCGVSNKK